MIQLVLLRHGESQWNLENRFSGWKDIDLTPAGVTQAREAGRQLQEAGFGFDVAYTSLLKRAIRTLWMVLDVMDLMWIPVHRSWRLNERHYGALEGLNKAETAAKYGDEQVLAWRRSYATRPPALDPADPRYRRDDPRYRTLTSEQLPLTESLKDTVERFMPLWNTEISPQVGAGKRVLIAAHGNTLRALVKLLERVSDDEIVGMNLPTGIPLVYELDGAMEAVRHYYLGDSGAVERAMNQVARQGTAAKA